MLLYNQSFVQICLLIGTVSQVRDVAHGPLVLLKWTCKRVLLYQDNAECNICIREHKTCLQSLVERSAVHVITHCSVIRTP